MATQNPIVILPGQPEIRAGVDTIHHGIFCDGPAVACQSRRSYIEGIRYHCAKCPDVDFCQSCLTSPANQHDKSHTVLACVNEAVFVNKHGLSEEEVRRRVQDIALDGAHVHHVQDEELTRFTNSSKCRYEHDDQRWAELGFEIELLDTQPPEHHIVEYVPKGNMKVVKTFQLVGDSSHRPTLQFYRPEDLVGMEVAPQEYDYTADREFYKLLEAGKPATRVIELLPGEAKDKLECNLRTISLDEPPQYEALSYTWKETAFDWPVDDRWTSAQGQAVRDTCDVRVPIYLAGTNDIISIGSGLRDALRCIRQPEKKLLVWADQICINQKDAHERAAQVGYMHDVYSKAQQVLLWVGEQDEYTELVYQFFSIIGAGIVSKARGGTLVFPSPETVKPKPDHKSEAWKRVWKFLDRPVFSRGWVIQEVTRGSRVIVKCGIFETPWENVASMARLLGSDSWVDAIKPGQYVDEDKIERLGCIVSLDNIRRQFHARGAESSLSFILYETRDFQVTDTRDKIYSLLGLRQPSFGIPPDYEISYASACIKATKWILQNEKAFSICTLVDKPDWTKPSGFPSWVPPYAVPVARTYPFRLGAPSMLYKASGSSVLSASWPIEAHPNLLEVSAYHCETVRDISRQIPGADEPTHIEVALNLFHYAELAKSLGCSTDVVKIFLRTCLCNSGRIASEYPVGEDSLVELATWFALYVEYMGQHPPGLDQLEKGGTLHVESFQNVDLHSLNWDLLEKGGSLLMNILQVAARGAKDKEIDASFAVLDDGTVSSVQIPAFGWATTVNLHRTMFTTENGSLGIGPNTMRPGDMVYIVASGPTPYILRRVSVDPDEYELVGEAYVHGLMDGEALTREGMEWQSILLR